MPRFHGTRAALLGSSSGWAVTPSNNYVGSIGDSISVAGGDMNGTVRLMNTSGTVGSYFTWGCCLPTTDGLGALGRPIHAGVSATSNSKIAAILSTDWPTMRDAAVKRGIIAILAGTNDLPDIVTASLSVTTQLASYSSLVDAIIANGQLPIICAVPPAATASNPTVSSATRTPAVIPWNTALRNLATQKRVPFCDLFTPVGNASTGAWANASYSNTDATHPSAAGAKLMGQAFRDTLETCLISESPLLVTNGDDTTGWKWLGGRFQTDAGVAGRPAGGFVALVEDTWAAPSNTATMSIAAASGGDVDGSWLKIAKTGTAGSSSSSTTGSTGNAPLTTTVNDVYVSGFKFKWDTLSGATDEVGLGMTLVDSANASNTVFNFQGYGWTAAGEGPFGIRVLGRKPPSASTYRWNYQVLARGVSGGTGNVYIGQLSVRQIA